MGVVRECCTKTEVSHGECEDQGASPGCLSARPGVSCRGEAVGPQRAPKPRLHPWDTSVFAPESRARGVLFARRNKAPIEYQADTEESWPIGRAVELACSLSLTARQRVRLNRQKRTRLKSSTSQRRARSTSVRFGACARLLPPHRGRTRARRDADTNPRAHLKAGPKEGLPSSRPNHLQGRRCPPQCGR